MITNIKKIHLLRQFSLIGCVVFLSLILPGQVAYAVPVAKMKLSTVTPTVGQIVTFNGSSSICSLPTGCSYTWQWFWRSPDGTTTHVGGQMGRTPTVKYAFNAFAAAKPYVIVTLTVGEGRLRRPSTASVAFRILPK